jgi:prophage regulatory protein
MDSALHQSPSQPAGIADRLLNKRDLEERTSLDISTIYRKMKAGTFPQPVQIGRRRVAWRESDVAEWQRSLEVGTRFPSPALASHYRERRDAADRRAVEPRNEPERSRSRFVRPRPSSRNRMATLRK